MNEINKQKPLISKKDRLVTDLKMNCLTLFGLLYQ